MIRLIRGGTLVTSTSEHRGDILIVDGLIDRVSDEISGVQPDDILDASGLHVFPGFIDSHVHVRDPGQTDKEDFAHASDAAAAGGITTILVMSNTVPPITQAEEVDARARYYEASARVDFGLWALALGHETPEALRSLRDAGIVATKLFWGYAFDRTTRTLRYDAVAASDPDIIPPATTGDVWRLFESAERAGVIVGVHCEDHSLVTAAAAARPRPETLRDLALARPAVAETVAVASVVELARATGARAHVLHCSAARSAELVRRARSDGVDITAETCSHYLTLDPDELAGSQRDGKVYPPPRGGDDTEGLWRAVEDGTIGSLSSDHAPHAGAERTGPYADQPAGIAGTETMVQTLLDAALRRQLPLPLLADRLSEGSARLYGLYPRKGSLEVGTDADLTIVDLERQWTVTPAALHSKDRSSPWEGTQGRGKAVLAMVRGNVVMRDGEPVGEPVGRIVKPGGG